MKKLEYSPIVRNKLRDLKKWLTEQFDDVTAKRILSEMTSDADILKNHDKAGTSIKAMYDIDTDYWYLFTHQHYLVYRIEPKKVIIVQMFHEREDFMMKLFGISGRTQESIDYWGE